MLNFVGFGYDLLRGGVFFLFLCYFYKKKV